MCNSTTTAPAAGPQTTAPLAPPPMTTRLTTTAGFINMGTINGNLFEVRAGVLGDHALEMASSLLAIARQVADDATIDTDLDEVPAPTHRMWAASYLMAMSEAIVEAVLNGEEVPL